MRGGGESSISIDGNFLGTAWWVIGVANTLSVNARSGRNAAFERMMEESETTLSGLDLVLVPELRDIVLTLT